MIVINKARNALLVGVAILVVANALPTPKNILDTVLNLGGIFRPQNPVLLDPSTSLNNAITTSNGPEVVTITQTIMEIIEHFATPGLSQYPSEDPAVMYMNDQGDSLPLPTLQPLGLSPLDPLTLLNGPLGTLQSPATSVVSIESLATSTGGLQDPQETDGPSHSTSIVDTVIASYYADWAAKQLAPEDVDFSRFNWVDFAFAVPDENFDLTFTQSNSEELLHRLVAAAHAQGRSVKLSVGGWLGSAHFSRAVRNSAGREKLCQSILGAYERFNLDGIDIDWEYPNGTGAGNEKSSNDSANFLKFLKLLRKKLPVGACITAATPVVPFAGKDGQPLSDMSGFSSVLDWILIMNYDVWGSSPAPGPNSPLSNGCGNSSQPLANAETAIHSWINAGFSARQIVLGIPAYGYVSRSSAGKLATRADNSTTAEVDAVELQSDDGGSDAGQIQFNLLVRQGALVRNNGGDYDGAGGFERRWDTCSSTPWLRSEARQQVITYDDPKSMRLKGELAREYGILGVNMFAAHGDDSWSLVDAARRGIGLDV